MLARVSPSTVVTRTMLALVSSLATAGLASTSASAIARRSRCEDVWFSLLSEDFKDADPIFVIARITFM